MCCRGPPVTHARTIGFAALLVLEWLYVIVYIGGAGLLFEGLHKDPDDWLRKVYLPAAYIVILAIFGGCAIWTLLRQARQAARWWLLGELILMLFFPLVLRWLAYLLFEAPPSILRDVATLLSAPHYWASEDTPGVLIGALGAFAYPAVFLHKLYLFAVYVPRRLRQASAAG